MSQLLFNSVFLKQQVVIGNIVIENDKINIVEQSKLKGVSYLERRALRQKLGAALRYEGFHFNINHGGYVKAAAPMKI